MVEAKDVRFPPPSKLIETVGQKIGICGMQCCSDMVIYIYIYICTYMSIYIIFLGFSFDLEMLGHDAPVTNLSFIRTGTPQNPPMGASQNEGPSCIAKW